MTAHLFWIPGPWIGKLAILTRPRGGDWLSDDLDRWQHTPLHTVVSLLAASEETELDLTQECTRVQQRGMTFLSFPIPDRGIPASLAATQQLIATLLDQLHAGQTVGVHCRQGVGRSAIIVASLLVAMDVPLDTAFGQIAIARGCAVPDTREQRLWVARFGEWMHFQRE